VSLHFAQVGIVEAVNGPAIGPASQISYDVSVSGPNGGVTVISGMQPVVQRWPDEIHVIAFEINAEVIVASIEGLYKLMTAEIPAFGCE